MSSAADGPQTVNVDGVGPVLARIYGVLDKAGDWTDSGPIPVPAEGMANVYITALPFSLGRTKPADKPDSQFYAIDSSKISREHAIIQWDNSKKYYTLKCTSKNGVDVNKKHVEMDEVVPLPSQSAIRMGPFYCYFLLPKREEKKEPAREKESHKEKERERGDVELKGVEGVDEVKKPRISYNFKKICEQAAQAVMPDWVVASVSDFIKAVRETNDPGNLPETDDYLRKGVLTALRKADSGWDQIEASAIPPDLFKSLCAPHARKPTSWFKKTGAAMPAAAPPAPAPAPSASAPEGSASVPESEDIEMTARQENAPSSNMMEVDAHAPLMPLNGDGDIVEL